MNIAALVDEGLGNSSYLVDLGDRRALAIDPPRDVRELREAAQRRGLTISHSAETHLHADFITESRELAASGGQVIASRAANLEWPHRPLDDGDEVDLDGLVLRALATPGHTPEHLSYLLLDGSRPIALFSGGALLPGSVARTDLIAPDQTEPLARSLYRALHERLLTLPDDLVVYPTHGAGSFCSAAAGGGRTTTIGRERTTNPLLQAPNEDAFVHHLASLFGTYPPYFLRLRELNRQGPTVHGHPPVLPTLDLDAFDRARVAGAELVDARPMDAYAAGHIEGSLSIVLRSAFASWLGWLVDMDRPIVFMLADGQDRRDLVRQALGIGYERLVGELAGGISRWQSAGRPLATTSQRRTADSRRPLVDVRQASEFRDEHVAGAASLELGRLATDGVEGLDDGMILMCGHGERAMTGASLAERAGKRVAVFRGGPRTWMRQATAGSSAVR